MKSPPPNRRHPGHLEPKKYRTFISSSAAAAAASRDNVTNRNLIDMFSVLGGIHKVFNLCEKNGPDFNDYWGKNVETKRMPTYIICIYNSFQSMEWRRNCSIIKILRYYWYWYYFFRQKTKKGTTSTIFCLFWNGVRYFIIILSLVVFDWSSRTPCSSLFFFLLSSHGFGLPVLYP